MTMGVYSLSSERDKQMPIQVALYTKTIGGRQFAFDTGDISFGDAETKDIPRNTGTDITTIQLRKRSVTFTIRGANAADIQAMYGERDDNITQLVTAGTVTGADIEISGDTIYNAYLRQVTPGAPITVAGQPLIEQTTVEFVSQQYT